MGNSESNTTKNYTPKKQVFQNRSSFKPVYGYNYQPTSYVSQEYPYVIDPASYPIVPSEYYFPNGVPLPQEIYTALEPPMYNQSYQQNQQLPQHIAHNYPHHLEQYNQQPPTSVEQRVNLPVRQDQRIFQRQPPGPLPPPASFEPQKPVSSVTAYKVPSPVVNNEVTTLPPSSLPVHHPPSVVIEQPPVPIVPHNSASPTITTDRPLSPLIIREVASPTSLATPNKYGKVQIIHKSYRSQSPSSHSIHHYIPTPTSKIEQNSSKITTSANRWYDHGYEKRVQSFPAVDA